jgi:hypothetical protein
MKTNGTKLGLTLLVVLAVGFGAYHMGQRDVWLSEFKTYDGNLVYVNYLHTNYSPELKEFLKARYYYLANRIPKSWLVGSHDYGPVATNVSALTVGKGPTTSAVEYPKFKERLGR